MEQKVVRKREEEIEDAVAGVNDGMGLRKLPLLPSRQTMRLMEKAAVTVTKLVTSVADGPTLPSGSSRDS